MLLSPQFEDVVPPKIKISVKRRQRAFGPLVSTLVRKRYHKKRKQSPLRAQKEGVCERVGTNGRMSTSQKKEQPLTLWNEVEQSLVQLLS